jgi:hypothetical protein
LKLYVIGLVIGIANGVIWTLHLSTPSLHAQSAIWEVIAQPEPVGGAMLAIVRHAATKQCYLIAQSEGLAVLPVSGTLCGDPASKWESLIIGDIDPSQSLKDDEPRSYWRMTDPSSQPSAGQTSKQPGVP